MNIKQQASLKFYKITYSTSFILMMLCVISFAFSCVNVKQQYTVKLNELKETSAKISNEIISNMETQPLVYISKEQLEHQKSGIAEVGIAFGLSKELAMEYASYIVDASSLYQVPVYILVRMICIESSWNAEAKSNCNAMGLMQIRWCVWKKFLVDMGICKNQNDLLDPQKNVYSGAAIVHNLYERYDGDWKKIMKSYSGGASLYWRKIFVGK